MTDPKVALVTTTINIPHVLELYRACDENVRFFVVGDLKTPPAAVEFIEAIPNTRYIPPDEQKRWTCSEFIGWNCVQRRNIATLEALKWGAESIVTIDDDNIPMDINYFDHYVSKLNYPFSGPCIQSFDTWFDPGSLLLPPAKHRGFPFSVKALWGVNGIINVKIGVCAGMCLGDPDIDAMTRMTTAPHVHGVVELARSGVVIDQHAVTVFNSQNTAFVRKLAPLMFMWPGVGRYDDIFASLVVQRYIRNTEWHLHLGQPFIYQQRNAHNLIKDLHAEMLGMERVEEFAQWLDERTLGATSPVEFIQMLCQHARHKMHGLEWFPTQAIDAGLAWAKDVEKVL